jgi:hypothetical protein
MTTFLLTWNPDGRGWPLDDYEATVTVHSNGAPDLGR